MNSKINLPSLVLLLLLTGICEQAFSQETKQTPALPNTSKLEWNDPLDERMMKGAHAFVERKIAETAESRKQYWKRDFSNRQAYEQSIEPNRQRLKFLLGVDSASQERNTHIAIEHAKLPIRMERIGDDDIPAVLFEDKLIRITRVRWPVMTGVHGEGLLLEPKKPFSASAVVIPDADQNPEELAGLIAGVPAEHQIARRLAMSGVRVIVPTLINRDEVSPQKPLGQSNREWIYRQAFHMGRHVIGYEVDKIIAAIRWLEKANGDSDAKPIGVAGWGEGALLAMYSAALEPRIDATLISGDWNARGDSWREPIYRNVWSLAKEFDDADIASMIAPRMLIVEQSIAPKIDRERDKSMPADSNADEVAAIFDAPNRVQWEDWFQATKPEGDSLPFAQQSQKALATSLNCKLNEEPNPIEQRTDLDLFISDRHRCQLIELDDFTQRLARDSEFVRNDFYLNETLPVLQQRRWSTEAIHETTPVEEFTSHTEKYRKIFHDEVLGRFEDELAPPNPRTRLIKQTDRFRAYDVVLDVNQELFAWGILMLPLDIEKGRQLPVVVVQHGRNGLPEKVMNGGYNGIAEKLVDRGFIVFAPHNLYRGEDKYRWLDRKSNSISKSLFSFLILQHEQITRWLGSLPYVNESRIAFYGNSYGGESAVRIPTIVTNYALSICASDFNDWTRKVTDTHDKHSFMDTIEWEMPYFNMGQTFSYAEMAYLMIPRPFMVERGHHDLVAPDHWVASEYAKVRLVYDQLGIGDRTAITFFQGGHTMRGEETLQFLEKHLIDDFSEQR